ncbi:MAG: AbrB family transcriptional regulator [Hyphomicrobiales bacterium]
MSFRPSIPVITGLVVAAVGGWLASLVGIPLPWMLGAIIATLAAALLKAPIAPPTAILAPMRATLGVLLGASITPELLERFGELAVSLLFVPLFIIAATALGLWYFTRITGMSRAEAFFSALPGGLYTMVAFAEDMGVDIKRIALVHALRVTLVVMLLPFMVYFFAQGDAPLVPRPVTWFADVPLRDLAFLTACAVVGWWVGTNLRIPGGAIIGPLVFSAALHITGVTSASPPMEAVVIAQVVLGAAIGCRFVGVDPKEVSFALVHSLGFVVLMLALTVLFAWVISILVDIPTISGVLAFAPGGLAEMSLVALSLRLDVGYVATLHVVRILLVMCVAPSAYKLLRKRLTG